MYLLPFLIGFICGIVFCLGTLTFAIVFVLSKRITQNREKIAASQAQEQQTDQRNKYFDYTSISSSASQHSVPQTNPIIEKEEEKRKGNDTHLIFIQFWTFANSHRIFFFLKQKNNLITIPIRSQKRKWKKIIRKRKICLKMLINQAG